ncbi:ribulokinase [Shouchella patagoniensis]|uniref:ribulokinase n=1 Tax=Shouchella patagoniensis TaxID=228576 RepID=UPI0009956A36|nr:ribulokinase [Shouchella patagoniensis]
MKKRYTIGIDYGTESGRAVLVDLENGAEVAEHVTPYAHGVMDECLPGSGVKLEPEWALQHPRDYLDVLEQSIPAVLDESGINASQVIGVGIDFTACTMLPIDEDGEPLCFQDRLVNRPHAWVKLWKHHAAQDEADEINRIGEERGESFLARYGGKYSSEWMMSKIWQVFNEDREMFDEADAFLEGTDWVIAQLSGTIVRNSCTAGYKAMWHKQDGYPEEEFFAALHPDLKRLTSTKLRGEIRAPGEAAGGLTKEMAKRIGLLPGTAVAVGNVDAHVSVPATGVVAPGKLVMAMGTSICHLVLSEEEKEVEGMCGVVEDGIIPGYFGYEAGQSAVGDIFAWFIEHGVSSELKAEAKQKGLPLHSLLEEKAATYQPGETGLLALDWWNGNRSTLVDTNLTGLILGYTLQTKPEELYRALLEATAFGTKKIVDAFNDSGVEVNELYACGGLPQKNKLLMQIYADVTNLEIKVAASKQTPALGAAMYASVAAGEASGGYATIFAAAEKMARINDYSYKPNPENVEIYKNIYREYSKLHDYFGRGENHVMKTLRSLRDKTKGGAVHA